MKTHILFLSFTALLLVACASKEGRQISSTQTQEDAHEQVEYSQHEANSGREVSRQ